MEAMSSDDGVSDHNSNAVCERIIETGLHADMLKYLSWDTLTARNLNNSKAKAKREFVEWILSILHNVVRKIDSARNAFRKQQAFEVLQTFCDVDESTVCYFIIFI